MKFREIMQEDPVYDASELPKSPIVGNFFYSENTLQDEFIYLTEVSLDNKIFHVFMGDDKSSVVIGEPGNRMGDQKPGIFIDGQLILKHSLDLGGNSPKLLSGGKVLQVDLVKINQRTEIGNIKTRQGLGYNLYKSVVEAGYTLVSDTLQYRGGKALWKKIAPMSKHDGFQVFILSNGEFISDESGEALAYDGDNIPDDQIWSQDATNKHVLLVARKT
jgi:hypothetical protein